MRDPSATATFNENKALAEGGAAAKALAAALREACREDDANGARRLLDQGADPLDPDESTGRDAMGEAVAGNCLAAMEALAEHGCDVDAPLTVAGWTVAPLWFAAAHNARPMVELLLGLGADPDRFDPTGRATPMMGAAWRGCAEAVETLLRVANPCLAGSMGETALALACDALGNQGLRMVRMLAPFGGASRTDARGVTPIERVARAGDAAMLSELLATIGPKEGRAMSPRLLDWSQGAGAAAVAMLAVERWRGHEALERHLPAAEQGDGPARL